MRVGIARAAISTALVVVGYFGLTACWIAWAAPNNEAESAVADPLVTEARTFSVKVDGKPAGTFTITSKPDDAAATITVSAVADIQIRKGPFTYKYSLRSSETWKGDRVTALDSTANDDGKRHSVKATAADGGLTVTANGRIRAGRADVLTTTGWRGPDPKARDVILLDTEDGSETVVQVQSLGACQVAINGQIVDGQKYRLTGKGVDSEWWFDATGRPIQQRMIWDGHKVVMDLTGVSK
jgi:hypothetical protein